MFSTQLRPGTWRLVSALLLSLILVSVGDVTAAAASADSYPSWAEVQAAKSSEAAKQAEVARINGLITGLQSSADAAQSVTETRTAESEAADNALAAGQTKAASLASRAEQLQVKAKESHRQAGLLAARLARTGSRSVTGMLLTSGSLKADALLNRLSSMSKLTETANGIYETAAKDENLAKSVSDQAAAAKNALSDLAQKANLSLDRAMKAQKDMFAALATQTDHQNELQAQLASLTTATTTTENQYQAGVAARAAAAAAAARAAAAAAAAAAARTAQSGPATAAIVPSGAQALAQELMGDVYAGRLAGASNHIIQIQWIAQGRSVPNCGIDTQVLKAVVVAVHTFGSAGISDINRRCTWDIIGAGIYSQHYLNGGGHAVDFNSLGGQATNGSDRNSLTLIRVLDPIMPPGSGLGQRQCRLNAGNEPRLQNFQDFSDTCNHLHLNDPM